MFSNYALRFSRYTLSESMQGEEFWWTCQSKIAATRCFYNQSELERWDRENACLMAVWTKMQWLLCGASSATRPHICPQGLSLVPLLLSERSYRSNFKPQACKSKTHLWKKPLPLMVLNDILCSFAVWHTESVHYCGKCIMHSRNWFINDKEASLNYSTQLNRAVIKKPKGYLQYVNT